MALRKNLTIENEPEKCFYSPMRLYHSEYTRRLFPIRIKVATEADRDTETPCNKLYAAVVPRMTRS